MKAFTRWLYMKMYRAELLEIARAVRANDTFRIAALGGGSPESPLFHAGHSIGVLDTLAALDLMEHP